MAFAVTNPVVLVGLPMVVVLVAWGPHDARGAILVCVLVATAALGDRAGLWWFERGWPLLLGGTYVWVSSLQRDWSFSARALGALGAAALVAVGIFLVSPGAWLDLDALMAVRAREAANAMVALLDGRSTDGLAEVLGRITRLQAAVFPALLGMSSLGALGLAVVVRDWLIDGAGARFGRLRNFRFNDHLVWIWLGGLALLLLPLGDIAQRVGGNAVFFMGALYVLRGVAVLLSLIGGVSWGVGVTAVIVAVLIAPLLVLFLGVALMVGLGDTWLDVRRRLSEAGGPD